MAKVTQEDILEFIGSATILELNELVKAIEEKFGVTAAAPVAAAAAAPVEADVAAGPTEVSVYVTEPGQSKVAVIKVVREVTGLGLVEAKGLVDKAPIAIKEKIKPEEADEIKKKLIEAGATVEVK
ncbi:MAG: 50S ribosomal protein L7/L12 [Erysipelotrichaceae bacterium]|jgi:large subunit ribosomal protein L7/L12|nr:50S ribosomal protein L7/L12 [Erysipelotrichaceae bacterium]